MNIRVDKAAKVLAQCLTHALLCQAGVFGGVVSASAQVQQAWAARYANAAAGVIKVEG